MTTLTLEGQKVDVNPEGFLLDSSQWTPAIAESIAQEVGIRLTDRHWKVLSFCREDAAREGTSPGLRRIAKLSGVEMKELYQLFPKGPAKLAAKIGGIPKPKGCI